MSYTPTTWATGDTITAAGLNKIEQGIAGAGSALICSCSYDDDLGEYALDKTLQEIYDALLGGTPVYVRYQYGILGTDYSGSIYLAPIIKIYHYDYTNMVRVCAAKMDGIGAKNGLSAVLSPSVVMFSATAMNDRPQYYGTIAIPNANVSIGGLD